MVFATLMVIIFYSNKIKVFFISNRVSECDSLSAQLNNNKMLFSLQGYLLFVGQTLESHFFSVLFSFIFRSFHNMLNSKSAGGGGVMDSRLSVAMG